MPTPNSGIVIGTQETEFATSLAEALRRTRSERWRQAGLAASWKADDLQQKARDFWRGAGDEFLWGVAFEVVNLRRFAAWATTL